MRNTTGEQTKPSARSKRAESVVALLAAAGIEAVAIARCPEPTCPICSGRRRAAA